VVGWPIDHSLSPALHRAAYQTLGLEWTFDALPVELGQLDEFVASLDGSWRGLAVTMPHKADLLALGEPEADALLVGAGNTLIMGTQPQVFNTDICGFQVALRHAGVEAVTSAVVLGAGATARSAVVALSRMGLQHVLVQTRSKNGLVVMSALTAQLGIDSSFAPLGRPHDPCDLLLSTLPSRAADPYVADVLPSSQCVFDVAYAPWPSLLIEHAANRVPVVTGVDLLAGQAVRQIELFTVGKTVTFQVLRDAGWAELSARTHLSGTI
jgi:shikimate dehydrogenase